MGVLAYNPPSISNQFASEPSRSETSPGVVNKAQATTSNKTKSSTTNSAEPATPVQTEASTPPVQPKTSGTYDGNVTQTKYGPVQVRIVVSGGRIVNAEALQVPSRDSRSKQISQQMIPWLIQETLNQQSTSIMNVSGATITTNGWKASLASAIQKAGL